VWSILPNGSRGLRHIDLRIKGINRIADAAGIQSRRINLADRPAV
jgi:hypothetical protein